MLPSYEKYFSYRYTPSAHQETRRHYINEVTSLVSNIKKQILCKKSNTLNILYLIVDVYEAGLTILYQSKHLRSYNKILCIKSKREFQPHILLS